MNEEIDTTIMSLHDILDKLGVDLSDEIRDSNKYLDMGKSAEEMCHYDLAHGLYLAGYDEYTHAKFIHDTLTKHNITIDKECNKKFDDLCCRIKQIFR